MILASTPKWEFIVKGTKEVSRMATLFPKQSCTCQSTGKCYHVLDIKINLNMATGREVQSSNQAKIMLVHRAWLKNLTETNADINKLCNDKKLHKESTFQNVLDWKHGKHRFCACIEDNMFYF